MFKDNLIFLLSLRLFITRSFITDFKEVIFETEFNCLIIVKLKIYAIMRKRQDAINGLE